VERAKKPRVERAVRSDKGKVGESGRGRRPRKGEGKGGGK
jgi:hypothetical protein